MPVHGDLRRGAGGELRRHGEGTAWAAVPMAVIMALGFWLILAPTLLSYADQGTNAASWNDRIVGAALVVAAAARIATPIGVTALGILVAVLGGWLVAAPSVLHFDGAPRATTNDLVTGAAVVVVESSGLPSWIGQPSPFLAAVPDASVNWKATAVMISVALIATVVGAVGYARRDLGS